MSTESTFAYDQIPYHSKPVYPSHPDSLAAVATLLGLKPPAIEKCRVLEIGCAAGGNLIPMALELPGSQFVGVDLSARQIGDGQETIRAVGLTNIELFAMNLADIDDSFGTFDYILCHGVFSWITADLQDKIFSICQKLLAPNGLAYISYNTYPGWSLHKNLRDLMVLHTNRFPDAGTRLAQAKELLQFFVRAESNSEDPLAQHMQGEIEDLLGRPDYYIYHEYLERDNYPCYFSEFMTRAHGFGLQYLGESSVHLRLDSLRPEVRKTLLDISEDLIQLEQFHDFLRNRKFRRTILCRAEVEVNRGPSTDVVLPLLVTGLSRPQSEHPELLSDKPETFEIDRGGRATTDRPLTKVLLFTLYESWPQLLTFDELWEKVLARFEGQPDLLPQSEEEARQLLALTILQSFLANFLSLHVITYPFTTTVSGMPYASPLARYQAAQGMEEVASLRHLTAKITEFEQILLPLLDGTRDRGQILEALIESAISGRLAVQRNGEPLTDRADLHRILSASLEPSLESLAFKCLLAS